MTRYAYLEFCFDISKTFKKRIDSDFRFSSVPTPLRPLGFGCLCQLLLWKRLSVKFMLQALSQQ
jgi:hypothetical protein